MCYTRHDVRVRNQEANKTARNLLRIAQTAMERAMLAITLRDRHRSTWIRAKTRVKDIVQVVKKEKWKYSGYIA